MANYNNGQTTLSVEVALRLTIGEIKKGKYVDPIEVSSMCCISIAYSFTKT